MTDFDEVMERLVNDPGFEARLAADPVAALAGYSLAPYERELLDAQFVVGDATDRTVETRTSKSGVIGLIGPVLSAIGVGADATSSTPIETIGRAGGGHEPLQTMGSAPPSHVTQSLGGAPTPKETIGHSPGDSRVVAADYHTRVDADGDGHWDAYTAYERPDGGVDVEVDVNHDDRVDFVGHDLNRDGLIDSADFDNDFDGTFETRMYDETGDGWMDRAEAIQPHDGPKESFGGSPR